MKKVDIKRYDQFTVTGFESRGEFVAIETPTVGPVGNGNEFEIKIKCRRIEDIKEERDHLFDLLNGGPQ